MKRILIALVTIAVPLCVLLCTLPNTVLATDVNITAAPSYISFSSAPTTWTLNGITGSGTIIPNTTYYSNPLGDTTAPAGATVADAECQFTWTNDSSVNITITVNCGAFTGGSCDMTNGNSGSPGATTYGAYAWYSGMTYANKVQIDSSGSGTLYTTVAAGADKKWGAELTTRTNAWAGGTSSTATMVISAVAA